jgi:hypothetical protein
MHSRVGIPQGVHQLSDTPTYLHLQSPSRKRRRNGDPSSVYSVN